MGASEIAGVLVSIFGGGRIFIARGELVDESEYVSCTTSPCAFIGVSTRGGGVHLQIHKYIGVDGQNNPHIRLPGTLDAALREIEEVIAWTKSRTS